MQAVRWSQFVNALRERNRHFYFFKTAAILFLITLSQQARAFSCDCLTPEETKTFELAAISCKTEMQRLQCSKLTDVDPSLQEDLQKCDAKSVCEAFVQERMNTIGPVSPTTIKACFWAGADIAKEIWAIGESIPPEMRPYLSSPMHMAAYLGYKMGTKLAQTSKEDWESLPQKISNATSDENIIKQSKKLWTSGVSWVEDKHLKLQCFNVQAQQEMVCYGILSVWGPERAVALGAKGLKALKILNATKKAEGLELAAERATNNLSRERLLKDAAELRMNTGRAQFTASNVSKKLTTVKQREAYVVAAKKPIDPLKRKYFEAENAMLKKLNDQVYKDKDFVTALTNKNQEILLRRLQALKVKYPDVEFSPYSDFKSVRVAIESKKGNLPKGIDKELESVFTDSYAEYISYLRSNKLIRDTDGSSDWFRAGFADSADLASLSARYARLKSSDNMFANFSNPNVAKNIKTYYEATDHYRKEVTDIFKGTKLLEAGPGGKKILDVEAFDTIRKAENEKDLITTLAQKYQININEKQARNIRDYVDLVNDFNPSLRVVEEKQLVSLRNANNGGMSIDFKGLNAKNLQATAKALANSNGVEDAMKAVRLGEEKVTANFARQKSQLQKAVAEVMQKHKIKYELRDSGDDMMLIPSKALDGNVRAEIFAAMSKSSEAGIRSTHVSTKFPSFIDKTIIATHGESLEKLMIKNLDGKIPPEKISKINFMVDLQPGPKSALARVYASDASKNLAPSELKSINEAFQKSLQQFNADLDKKGISLKYSEGQ